MCIYVNTVRIIIYVLKLHASMYIIHALQCCIYSVSDVHVQRHSYHPVINHRVASALFFFSVPPALFLPVTAVEGGC